MEYQIAIYSSDEIFARMLELDFVLRGCHVLRAPYPQSNERCEVAIVDLDSSALPSQESYRRMIGFTCNSQLFSDDVRRQCSMILHRPFEMRLLRREVFPADGSIAQSVEPSQKNREIVLDEAHSRLTVSEKEFVLTGKEIQVMKVLLENRGEPVSREALSQEIGESAANKVDVYICYLRRKLDETLGYKLIYTVRGKGYRIP